MFITMLKLEHYDIFMHVLQMLVKDRIYTQNFEIRSYFCKISEKRLVKGINSFLMNKIKYHA